MILAALTFDLPCGSRIPLAIKGDQMAGFYVC